MRYTSRHDLPYWSDPDYDECGTRHGRREPDPDEAYEQFRDQQDQLREETN